MPQAPTEPVLVSIGDISVTQSRIYTPSGSRPLSEVNWTVTDMSVTSQGIPTWAIVCAIVFFVFCLLGLLFLLVKETTVKGTMQVTVQGPGFVHTTQIPVSNPAQIADINARVGYVRTLTASGQAQSQYQSGQAGQPGQAGGDAGWQQQQAQAQGTPGWPQQAQSPGGPAPQPGQTPPGQTPPGGWQQPPQEWQQQETQGWEQRGEGWQQPGQGS